MRSLNARSHASVNSHYTGCASVQHARARRGAIRPSGPMSARGQAHAALFAVRSQDSHTDPTFSVTFVLKIRVHCVLICVFMMFRTVCSCTEAPDGDLHLWMLSDGPEDSARLLRAKLSALPQWMTTDTRRKTVRGLRMRACTSDCSHSWLIFFVVNTQARTALNMGQFRLADALVKDDASILQKGKFALVH